MPNRLRILRVLAAGAPLWVSPVASAEVVLLGDPVRVVLAGSLDAEVSAQGFLITAPGGARFVAPQDGVTLAAIADRLYASKRALLVVDATVGPTPTIREHILLARQAGAGIEGVYLARAEQLAPVDRFLLDLEREEIGELLDLYGFPKEDVAVVASPAPLARALRERPPQLPASDSRAFAGDRSPPLNLYWLSTPESPGTRPVRRGDEFSLWVAGRSYRVTADSAVAPGAWGSITVHAREPVQAPVGARCFIARAGHLRGACTIAERAR